MDPKSDWYFYLIDLNKGSKEGVKLVTLEQVWKERVLMSTLWPAETSTRGKGWEHSQSEAIWSTKFNVIHEQAQQIHNHLGLQQKYTKPKSMGKQSNNFIY
jgi:hypothetical protein